MFSTGVIAGLLNVIGGSADTAFSKYITTRLGKYKYAVMILGIGVIPTLLYFLITGGLGIPSLKVALLTILGSVFFGTGFVLFYKAMETQQITNAAVLGEVQPLILLIFGVIVLGEPITAFEALGALAIFAGAFLVLTTEKMKINWLLIPIILANICWATYWILLTYAIQFYGGEAVPVLLARACAFLFVFAYALRTRQIEKSIKRPTTFRHSAILYGFLAMSILLDSSINILFGFVVSLNLVALGSILLAAGPLLTSVFGRIFFNDKLTKAQKIGFVLALIGAVSIGAG